MGAEKATVVAVQKGAKVAREKPKEPVHQRYGAAFDAYCRIAGRYWELNTLPSGEPIIFVDLLAQDIRVAVRVLTMAAGIKRHRRARIVALIGPDPFWENVIWSYYNREKLTQIAEAYGADAVLDINEIIEASIEGESTFELLGKTYTIPERSAADPQRYREIAEATHLRALRVPRITDEILASEEYADIEQRCDHYSRLYDALMGDNVEAFITSHIDYHQWGYAVDSAMRLGVTIHHVQSTGSFKSYALFPETVNQEITCRMNWTNQIGEYFEKHVWPLREVLEQPAELAVYRSKSNFGRPSWWRGGGAISQLGFRTRAERASVRRHAMRSLGMDQSKPVLAVYDHAVSDAVHSNHEIFDDLADWLEQTVEFASKHPEANWLFVDHPAQSYYDSTEMFEGLAEKYREFKHLHFTPSMALSKNALWSMVDAAITVRGSVSNEFPAYGVPAIQAGWSEWSHCGFTKRADSRDEYWQIILNTIDDLANDRPAITAEEVERARLWLWFYRAGTDVASRIVPHWESSQADRLYMAINLAMTHVEVEGDPGLAAVRRMLERRDPFLTRVDFELDRVNLEAALALPGEIADPQTKEQAAAK